MPTFIHRLAGCGAALLMACGTAYSAEGKKIMELKSSAFAQNADIPGVFTCEARDQSPPLTWSGIPAGTKSLALIVDDPDAPDPAAPKMTWVHWVLYNLPPDTSGLGAGASAGKLPAGAREGLNDWGQTGYRGPCPPIGRHRYVHKLFALDTVLPVLQPATKAGLERAMQGHILARGELVGYYRKKK
jgi:Raf kinase inhibitor-like YbhB/YbcL family protein